MIVSTLLAFVMLVLVASTLAMIVITDRRRWFGPGLAAAILVGIVFVWSVGQMT